VLNRHLPIFSAHATLCFLSLAWIWAWPFNAWPSMDIQVSPSADPLAKVSVASYKSHPNQAITLEQALALLRDPSLRDSVGEPIDDIHIHLAEGTYRIADTLVLDAASSGSAKHPITISGPAGAKAILSGSQNVPSFTPVTDPAVLARLSPEARSHVVQANLKALGITDYGQQTCRGLGCMPMPAGLEVFYRERPMTLARWPNNDFAKVASTPDGKDGRSFVLQGANLKAWLQEPELMASGYWFQEWSDQTLHVASIDLSQNKLTLAAPYPYYGIKIGARVFIQNALAELDQPGEWYLDKTNGLLYFWPPGPIQTGDVEVSLHDDLVFIKNAAHIRLANLTFENARGDGIVIQGGHDIAIAHSILHNLGERGAVISGQDNGLYDTVIEDTGQGGVFLNGGDRQTLDPGRLYVEQSRIQRFNRLVRTYKPAILLQGVGNRAVGNYIADAPHVGLLFEGNDHLILLNEITDVCRETGDAGVIYTGRDWTARGTVISYNYLHDIPPNLDKGGTMGVYLDDLASGITIRGNIFIRVNRPVFLGGGRDNLVENNVFIQSSPTIHLDDRGKTWQKDPTNTTMQTLLQRLAAVPYNKPPYSNHYPNMANILEDDPGIPKYNIARRNLVIDSKSSETTQSAATGIQIEDLCICDSILPTDACRTACQPFYPNAAGQR